MSNYIDHEELGLMAEILTTLNELSLDARRMLGQVPLFDCNGEQICVMEMVDDELVILVGA